jgi:CRISPR-associated protein Csb2
VTGQRTTTPPASVFSPHLTILTLEREDGPCRHLDLLTVLTITQRWREAILSRSNELPPHIRDLLSGHERNGSPLECPHPALAALASIGHRGADGRLHGLAVVLPDRTSHEDLRLALRAVGRIRRLVMGRLGVWSLEPQTAVRPESPLRPETWTAHPDGATHWSTVTPVVFDRHPKTSDRAAYQREVAAMIATSCTRIGLPEPREAIPTPVSHPPTSSRRSAARTTANGATRTRSSSSTSRCAARS